MSKWQWAWEGVLGVVTVLALATVLFTAPDGHFLNIVASSAPTGMVAVALSLSLRTGTPNLAVGSVSALSGALIATFVTVTGMPLIVGLLLVVLLAGIAGLVMGAFTVLLSAPSWAVTLASAVVCDGLLFAVSQGRTVILPDPPSLPPVVGFVLFAVVSVAGGVVWKWRDLRRSLSNEWVGPLAGLAGSCVLAALGGFMLLLRLGAAQPASQGLFTAVFALAAVVLGGTSIGMGPGTGPNGERGSSAVTRVPGEHGATAAADLPGAIGRGGLGVIAYGDRGAVGGTVFAVLLLAVIQGQLVLLGVPAYLLMVVLGGVVICGLTVSRALDALRPDAPPSDSPPPGAPRPGASSPDVPRP
ncbi:hypothetical protein [Nonomuraea sp. NPDC049695]|uniref:ABC transporter permease n=1 Tax=Nonomuraea sp. NPDC049695 TaxID=3154734 RepID=UPI00341544B3